jgi:hypothetical protein
VPWLQGPPSCNGTSASLKVLGTGVFSSGGISDELRTLIVVSPPHQPHHPLEAQCLQMIGLVEAPFKARPDVAILARLTKIT